MKNVLYNTATINKYVAAMTKWCKEVAKSDFYFSINERSHENWSCNGESFDGEDTFEDFCDQYYKFQSKWMKQNKMDNDILVLSVIKNKKFAEFVSDDS